MTRLPKCAAAILSAFLACAMLLAGCSTSGQQNTSTSTTPAISGTQAQQLALARYNTYRLGTVALDTTFTMSGTAVRLTGWVDYRARVAYAQVTQNGTPRNLLMWTLTKVALKEIGPEVTEPPLPQPELDGSWATSSIDTATSELQQILVVTVKLGFDRPDNALLVTRNGARFVRADTIDGEPMNVYAVPPTPTSAAADGSETAATAPTATTTAADGQPLIYYWISDAGAIRRATFTLASGTDVTVNLLPTDRPSLRDPFDPAGGGP